MSQISYIFSLLDYSQDNFKIHEASKANCVAHYTYLRFLWWISGLRRHNLFPCSLLLLCFGRRPHVVLSRMSLSLTPLTVPSSHIDLPNLLILLFGKLNLDVSVWYYLIQWTVVDFPVGYGHVGKFDQVLGRIGNCVKLITIWKEKF